MVGYKPATPADTEDCIFQGYVYSSMKQLTELFGEPTLYPKTSRVKSEWCVKFDDGNLATVYDYEEAFLPTGPYEYHIAGSTPKAADYIKKIVGNN